MSRIVKACLVASIATALVVVTRPVFQSSGQASTVQARGDREIGDFLKPDGRFDLNAAKAAGFEGPLNFTGFTTSNDPTTGELVFEQQGGGGVAMDVDDVTWSALGTGTNDRVQALCVFNSQLIVGGAFDTAGGIAGTEGIAAWNGTSWASLGLGVNGNVNALVVFNSQLVAGGSFSSAGGSSAARIAAWNGSSWSTLGTGMNSTVSALAVYNSQLYAGGLFTLAGGVSVGRIATWDGATWSGLGTGMNSNVNALTVFNSQLIAGGNFTDAGGVSGTNRIAAWNGSSWSSLGGGMDNTVRDLTVFNSQLIAGGDFSNAGGGAASRVAAWNGSTWSALGSGVNSFVWSLTSHNSQLIVGGDFTTAGGIGADRIAAWDGSSWTAMGSGMNGRVDALTTFNSKLIAGGDFTLAGGTAANHVASAVEPTTVLPGQGVTFAQVDFEWDAASFPDSRTGIIKVDLVALPLATGISEGYVNVLTNTGWVIQNLPVLQSIPYPTLSMAFDLGSSGNISNLSAYVEFSPLPLTSFSGSPTTPFSVGATTFAAEGRSDPVPPGAEPAPPPVAVIPFQVGGIIDMTCQPDHENVQAANSQCGPAAAANSFKWLKDKYGTPIPDPHVPGLGADGSLVGALDDAMSRPYTPGDRTSGSGVSDENFIRGKLSYLSDAGIDDIEVKHQAALDGDPPAGPSIDQGGLSSTREPGNPTAAWICNEIKEGEDVEIGYTNPGGGGHWVEAICCGTILGVPVIIHRSDQVQSDADPMDNMGTDGAQVGFPHDTDGDGVPNLVGEPNTPNMDIVVSESPKKTPVTDCLLSPVPGTYFGPSEWTKNGVKIGETFSGGLIPPAGTPTYDSTETEGVPNDWHWYVEFSQLGEPTQFHVWMEGFPPGTALSVSVISCFNAPVPPPIYLMVDYGTNTYQLADSTMTPYFSGQWSLYPTDLPSVWECVATGISRAYPVPSACDCPHQADINGDGFIDATDLAEVIDIVFFGNLDLQDPNCPTSRADFNNDGVADAVDLAFLIDHVFFGGDGPCDPCDPIQSTCTH